MSVGTPPFLTPLLLRATGLHVGEAGTGKTTVSDAAGQQEP